MLQKWMSSDGHNISVTGVLLALPDEMSMNATIERATSEEDNI